MYYVEPYSAVCLTIHKRKPIAYDQKNRNVKKTDFTYCILHTSQLSVKELKKLCKILNKD